MMRHRLLAALLLVFVPGMGCGLSDPPRPDEIQKPEKTYKGLAGQTCAVMVYADWRTRVDYGQLQGDLAKLIQQRLEAKVAAAGEKQDKKASRPATQFLNPLSVVRYQREHPEVEAKPIVEVAPRLNVSRLIYVELESFSAQSPESIMILKGNATATLRVLEISGGAATVAFEESGIQVHFPPDAPEGVVPSDKINVRTIYTGTLTRLADTLAVRFEE